MVRYRIFRWLLAAVAVVLMSQAPQAQAALHCPNADESGYWPAACLEATPTGRRIKPAYVNKLKFDKSGFATLMLDETMELLAVNKRGVVVISNIYFAGDFDFHDAEAGIGRFAVKVNDQPGRRSLKCGYFQVRRYEVVIPATYDNCLPFRDGKAHVCKDCTEYCTEPDCQDSRLLYGTGYLVDRNNKVLRQFEQGGEEDFCRAPQQPKVDRGLGRPRIYCRGPSISPFK